MNSLRMGKCDSMPQMWKNCTIASYLGGYEPRCRSKNEIRPEPVNATRSPNPESSAWRCRDIAFLVLPAVISALGSDGPDIQKCRPLQNNANRESTGFPTLTGQNRHQWLE